MSWLSVKHRITLGLVLFLSSSMLLVYFLGLGPNPRAAVMHGRAQLCETLAVQTSILAAENQTRELKWLLKSIVQRNDEVVSAGMKRSNGQEMVNVQNHFQTSSDEEETSIENFVSVPLRRNGKKWAELQLRFTPISRPGILGWVLSPITIFIGVVSMSCFLSFSLFLGSVLQQLDPSNAVPKRVRTALDTLTEGLIVTDRRGNVLLANETFCKWVGKPAKSLIGKKAESFPWQSVKEAPKSELAQLLELADEKRKMPWEVAFEQERPEAGYLINLTNAADESMNLIANASPVLGAEGTYRGVLTSFEDVTDLERHKVELSEAKLEADRANRAKSEFLARMSHEIRTPMNAILGYTEVLQFGMEDDPEKREQHLTTIQSSGEHLLALINDILDLSKIESGQLELELAPVSMHELLCHCISVLRIKAEEKGIQLDYAPKGPIPKTIVTDSVRVKQAIINLIGNAIKFTSEGGVLVQPQMVQRGKQLKFAIHVADTGIGMTAEAMAKIFDPFAQADTSITRRFGGTGLGLSICKELAEQLGGQINVSSQVGQGSVFTFEIDPGDLLNVEYVAPDELKKIETTKAKRKMQFTMPGARVLIVDDGESNRELVALFLKRAGIEYAMAVNGQEAVTMVTQQKFDAVLMDMQMPVMDGRTATQTLRTQGVAIPIIALTANAMPQDERKCREAGCTGFLPKPITRDSLYKALKDALPEMETRDVTQEQARIVTAATTSNETFYRPVTKIESMANGTRQTHTDQAEKETEQSEIKNYIRSSLPMDDDDFVEIAKMFANQLVIKLESMEQKLADRDFQELYNLGHWLKGAGGSAGFDDFNQPGKSLEHLAKAEDIPGLTEMIETLKEMESRIRVEAAQESESPISDITPVFAAPRSTSTTPITHSPTPFH